MIPAHQSLWRAHLLRLGAVVAALLAVFYRDAASMVAIWWNVSTYTHCLFVIPIVGWLIWLRRLEVAQLAPRSYAPGLIAVAAGGFLWVLGQAAGVALFRHAGLVFMIQSSVLAMLGPQVARAVLFPLFYLAFLVPFGDELVPMLQTVTAKLCMIFLGWVGIPAHIEGVFISIPTGAFEVAEACSGVKFLVAMVAYGALAANVCFKSWPRRIAFMIMAVTVPILANGLRAYGTIHISYLTGNNAFAESFDHIVFGWVFFALVLAIVMAIGWRFFDRDINDPWLEPGEASGEAGQAAWGFAGVLLAVALLPVGWQAASASFGRVDMPHPITLPDVPGWHRAPIVQREHWRPRFDGADHLVFGQYQNAQGERVDLAIALYGSQREGKEIVGYAQGAFDPETHWSWANDTRDPPGGHGVRIFAPEVEREVVSFYRIGGITTGNPGAVKFETLKAKLFGGTQAAVAVLVSSESERNRSSRKPIDDFLKSLGAIEPLADSRVRQAAGK